MKKMNIFLMICFLFQISLNFCNETNQHNRFSVSSAKNIKEELEKIGNTASASIKNKLYAAWQLSKILSGITCMTLGVSFISSIKNHKRQNLDIFVIGGFYALFTAGTLTTLDGYQKLKNHMLSE